MANKYVSTSGSNANLGTLGSPYRDIAYGMGQLASGDVLNIRSGTYTENIYLPTIASGGSWGTATTIQAYPPDLPTNPILHGYIVINGMSFIIFDGLNITGVSGDSTPLFYVDGCNEIWLKNCDVGNAWGQNISGESQPGFTQVDCRYTNIVSHDSGQGGANPSAPSHGIYISSQGAVINGPILIDSCTFYNHTADQNSYAIQIYAGSGDPKINGVILSNNITRNSSNGITFGDSDNGLIYNNTVHDNVSSTQGTGITIQSGTPTNTLIYNNTVYNNSWDGIQLGAFGTPSGTLIYNNTCYNNGTGSGGYGIRVYGGSGTIGKNNILYSNASGDVLGTGTFSNNLNTNPTFVNSGIGDFHIQSTSAARAFNGFTGVNLTSTFTTDKDNRTRAAVGNWDGGAYIYYSIDLPQPGAFILSPKTPRTYSNILRSWTAQNDLLYKNPVPNNQSDWPLPLPKRAYSPVMRTWTNENDLLYVVNIPFAQRDWPRPGNPRLYNPDRITITFNNIQELSQSAGTPSKFDENTVAGDDSTTGVQIGGAISSYRIGSDFSF